MSREFYPDYTKGRLHPESEAILVRIAEGNYPPLCAMSPEDARKAFVLREWLGEPRGEIRVTRTMAGGVPVRIYHSGEAGPLPVLIYFHGGGFVLGSLDEFEPFCTFLAAGAGCIVVSVGYRLAPEARYPAAHDDAWAAVRWVAENARAFGGEPSRLAVAGDSAGGNLAACAAMRARDEGGPRIVHQALLCPWVDLSPTAGDAESFHEFGKGLWLSTESLAWFRDLYLPDPELGADPGVSPLLAADLSELPGALVLLAEFDVLADQGRAYAGRLEEGGAPVTLRCYEGMLHDFVTLPGLFTPARQAIEEIAASLREAFART